VDRFPVDAWMNRSLTPRTGRCPVLKYMKPLLGPIAQGKVDPTPPG
jgi:hypothetical protein